MGLGINAANNPEFIDYFLTHETGLNLAPENASAEEISHFKSNFKHWLIGNGLRTVTESFEIYLQNIYEACSYIQILQGDTIKKNQFDSIIKSLKKFAHVGFDDKFKMLEDEFAIIMDTKDLHLSIKQARNCLSHRLGWVNKNDCNENHSLNIRWKGLELFGSKSGVILELPLSEPKILESGDGVSVRYVDKNRIFKIGSLINLTAKEVSEICLFYKFEVERINNMAVAYVKNNSDIFDKPKAIKIID